MHFFSLRNIDVNSINLLKNSFQFILGAVLYFTIFNDFYIWKFLIGLAGFLISYQSVYQFNDLMDYEDDRKDKLKVKTKRLARGEVSRKVVESYSFLFTFIGLSLCFLVSTLFGLLVSLILFLNFLHSSSFVRLKKSRFLLVNLFLIEFVKYSLGWFAFSFSVSGFPFIFILCLVSIYLLGYLYYKRNAVNFFKDIRIKVLCSLSLLFYLASIFLYSFKLPLLMVIPFCFTFLIFKRFKDSFFRLKLGSVMSLIIAIFLIISLIICSMGAFARINDQISDNIEKISDSVPIKIDVLNKFTPSLEREVNKISEAIVEKLP